MAQSLEVNNKTYLPSVALAKQFNYTSDYISKLARDEKVLGTRVGRQWYVEPESLRTYFQQLEVEKRIAKEDLSLQRKLERAEQPLTIVTSPYKPEPAVMVGGKTLVVLLCGLTLGSLLMFGRSYDLGLADIARGSEFIGEQLYAKVAVGMLTLLHSGETVATSVANPLYSEPTATLPQPQEEKEVQGTFTTFPDITYETESSVLGAEIEPELAVNLPFSDEVIMEKQEGSLGVRPIFKDATGQWYEVSVTAIETVQ